MRKFRKLFLRGSISHLLPLGAGFVLASSQTVEAALGMSLAIVVVTVLSAIIVSALRNVTPQQMHLPIYILIVTGITTILCMLMEAYWFDAFNALGVHLAALSVSAVPYRDNEEYACEHCEKETIICSLVTAGLFALVMIVCSLVIEPLVAGSIFGFSLGFAGIISAKAGKFVSYVLLAIVVALMRKIGHKICDELEAE